jgi:nucleotide-binding universal stress UspA family protein
MYKNILIATDGSEVAERGVKHGLELAKAIGAKATIVTVTEMWDPRRMAADAWRQNYNAVQEYDKAAAAGAKSILDAASGVASGLGVQADVRHVANEHPADGIIKTATGGNFDLIVMASHGRRGINRLLLGSVAMEVVSQSTVPTLIVR